MNTVVSVGATVVFMAMVVYALMERAQARKKHPAIVDIPRDIRFWIFRQLELFRFS